MFKTKPRIFIRLNALTNQILLKRKHQTSHLVLKHHNIYELPSRFGLIFLMFALLIFILGSNYQNNLILLTAYLFISVFIIGILQSYLNLMNTEISFVGVEDGIEKTGYRLTCTAYNKNKTYNLDIYAGKSKTSIESIVEQKKVFVLNIQGHKRGKHKIDRLKMICPALSRRRFFRSACRNQPPDFPAVVRLLALRNRQAML